MRQPSAHRNPSLRLQQCAFEHRQAPTLSEQKLWSVVRARQLAVRAKHAHHVWHIDISGIAIGFPGAGLWTAWWPFAFVLAWLACWRLVLVLDHYTRSLMAFSVLRGEPSTAEVCATLERAILRAATTPRHLISDQGTQFREEYRSWCKQRGIRPRFGAVGKHGSIAIIERFILSLKSELLWRVAIPARQDAMVALMTSYQRWYNELRPHSALQGRTPAEMMDGAPPPSERERIEPRTRYPLDAPRAGPSAARPPPQRPREKLELVVGYLDGLRELPIVELRDVA